jgi:hypothetical protein
MHFFVDFVRSRIPMRWKQNSSGWTTGNCPVCVEMGQPRPDTKGRAGFQIHNDEWGYHCFNCKVATRWNKGQLLNAKQKMLLRGFGCTDHELQRLNIELMRDQETALLLNPTPDLPAPFSPAWKTVDLPNKSEHITAAETVTTSLSAGLQMLADRGLTHHTDWAYSRDLPMRKRIILPYRYNGHCVGYAARYIGTPPAGTPKYLVQRPKGFVFNLDRQHNNRDFVIVTEGDFDALTLDGVALGSNSVSEEQASLIRQLRRRIILLPDADSAGKELIDPAIREGWNVSFPEWMDTHKDANSAAQEYGRIFVLRSIIESATNNPSKIQLLAKKYLRD